MKWITQHGNKIEISDMEDSHARNCIEMAIRNTSLQLIFELILEGRASLLKKNEIENTFELNGDMAQEFNNTFPGEEYQDINGDTYWYKEGF